MLKDLLHFCKAAPYVKGKLRPQWQQTRTSYNNCGHKEKRITHAYNCQCEQVRKTVTDHLLWHQKTLSSVLPRPCYVHSPLSINSRSGPITHEDGPITQPVVLSSLSWSMEWPSSLGGHISPQVRSSSGIRTWFRCINPYWKETGSRKKGIAGLGNPVSVGSYVEWKAWLSSSSVCFCV